MIKMEDKHDVKGANKMKLRSFLALVFCLSVLAGTSAGAAGAQETLWERTEPGGNYVTVRLTYPEAVRPLRGYPGAGGAEQPV